MANEYAYAGSAGEEEPQSPSSQGHSSYGISNPFGTPNDTPRNSFYGGPPAVPEKNTRSPPSAFPSFPFQSHAGNPDPGTAIPGTIGRRESIDSLAARAQNGQVLHAPGSVNHPLSPPGSGTAYPAGAAPGGYGLVEEIDDLGRPYAPFMGEVPERAQTPSSAGSQSQLYRNSAAAAVAGKGEYGQWSFDNGHGLPRTGSAQQISMRAPFLSPASRPTSSLWAPPSFPYAYPPGSGSSTALGGYAGSGMLGQYSSYADIQAQLRKNKPIMPSSKIAQKLTGEDKPWITHKDGRARASYWLTVAGIVAGIAGAAVLCYFTWVDTYFLADSQVCSYFYDDFSGGLDTSNTWNTDNELGGFGNGEFQITTDDSSNLQVTNGQLYITPTLTSDSIDGGYSAILNGGSYDLGDKCSTTNTSACSVKASNDSGTVVNPVISARINTKDHYSLKYGKVDVVAKLPQGDWLWPAIWMLPVNSTYGPWPLSGEIDIMEARGNSMSYGAQGVNYVRSSLNYGPMAALYTTLYGWWSKKQSTYADDFHTYTLEWTEDFMRLYVDTRLDAMLTVKIQGKGGKSFWNRGSYPSTAQNGSSQAVVENVWDEAGGGANAPFDQDFYLLIDLAVGGTSGWFPDGVGGKPWYDGSNSAMREFAEAQSTWSATWPSSTDDRSFRM
ncbi:concanavalin A-like lectin/glucanase domain-containing protein [Rhodofomes roseus]|uniref:Concanavalin A-like lectin/glucanase domain-containing protein n=1 Tax=Rhodofomes roseus TaxID=34475 RepID=A0ABQ8KJ72_9APHY|nr:concanavalin A-like lectin/glucanase domain-containing protein [Rhodofomes roseus]KAH9838018.1 concanavalin A-like lectin/glucanase domain-containing protein [Rhodofomes roseus]